MSWVRRRAAGPLRHKKPATVTRADLVRGEKKRKVSADGRCTAMAKNCSKCGHHYPGGDRSTNCPVCGKEHRCGNKAAYGTNVCFYHGAAAVKAQPPAFKFRVAHQILGAYTKLVASPDLLNLSAEIAAITARTDELFAMLDEIDSRGAHGDITAALESFETLFIMALERTNGKKEMGVNKAEFRAAIAQLRRAIEPANVEFHLWSKIQENIEVTRRLNETERKWLVSNEGMIPVPFVLEVLITIQRITLKYIISPQDRTSFANEFRNAVPIEAVAREVPRALPERK